MFPLEQLTALNVPITRLVTDSRAVQPGDTFVACPGEKADGRQFIAAAIEKGANAVIWDSQHFVWNDAWQVPNFGVADLRHKAGWLADAVYGAPSENLWLVGITGTNGKTSTCHWVAQALSDISRKCALNGTLGHGFCRQAASHCKSPAGCNPRAWPACRLFTRWRASRCDGGVLARAGAGKGERRALRCGNAHQSEPRSSRLSRRHGKLCGKQAQTVRLGSIEICGAESR